MIIQNNKKHQFLIVKHLLPLFIEPKAKPVTISYRVRPYKYQNTKNVTICKWYTSVYVWWGESVLAVTKNIRNNVLPLACISVVSGPQHSECHELSFAWLGHLPIYLILIHEGLIEHWILCLQYNVGDNKSSGAPSSLSSPQSVLKKLEFLCDNFILCVNLCRVSHEIRLFCAKNTRQKRKK